MGLKKPKIAKSANIVKEAIVFGDVEIKEVGGQAVLGRQVLTSTPWLTERHGYDPTSSTSVRHHHLRVSLRHPGRESRRQAVLGRQVLTTPPWLTERHGYDPT